jgi:L-ascorbate metabolism protein UlaG (beta-lactamase superfamily)
MLKNTLIGHASLLIQSRETTILTDPVWFDYLWEEINVLCPRTELNKNAKIPSPTGILPLRHTQFTDHLADRISFSQKNFHFSQLAYAACL